jgi:isopenicillin-N N-acyltransferase like protein
MSTGNYESVRISGAPHDRGVQLGQQSADRIRNSIAMYTEAFDHYTGLSWNEVRERALAYRPAIDAYDEEMIPEMEGTAEGAGLELEDILALNTRTEIMYGHQEHVLAECTAFGARRSATANGNVLMAQNWDWLPAAADSCILLEVDPDDRPSFVTFVEAGLLAKMGFNDHGVGMVTNLLLTEEDRGDPGVPFHAVLRRILMSPSFDDAVAAVTDAQRASSGNYLIASVDGDLVNLEARPGGVHAIEPESDTVHHANSFCGPIGSHDDRGLEALPDSPARTARMGARLEAAHGRLDLETISDLLQDHEGGPSSICRHVPDGAHPVEGIVTVASVILDLAAARMDLAFGQPCETPREPVVPEFARRKQPA